MKYNTIKLHVRGKVNKLQIVIENEQMWIMTYKQQLFFKVIPK